MAVPDDRWRVPRGAALAVAIVALAGTVGCAHPPLHDAAHEPTAQATPVPPPQTVTPAAPSEPPSTTELVPARVRGNEPIVIDEGGDSATSEQGLAAAADAEHRRREAAPISSIVIN